MSRPYHSQGIQQNPLEFPQGLMACYLQIPLQGIPSPVGGFEVLPSLEESASRTKSDTWSPYLASSHGACGREGGSIRKSAGMRAFEKKEVPVYLVGGRKCHCISMQCFLVHMVSQEVGAMANKQLSKNPPSPRPMRASRAGTQRANRGFALPGTEDPMPHLSTQGAPHQVVFPSDLPTALLGRAVAFKGL